MSPRGIRNNNPLNIRRSNTPWLGKVQPSTDRDFEQFSTMVYGIRAAFRIMRTYKTKYDVDTIAGIIQRWAPANENNTNGYMSSVAYLMGCSPSKRVDLSKKNFACRFARCIAYVETGQWLSMDLFYNAYDLAFPQTK